MKVSTGAHNANTAREDENYQGTADRAPEQDAKQDSAEGQLKGKVPIVEEQGEAEGHVKSKVPVAEEHDEAEGHVESKVPVTEEHDEAEHLERKLKSADFTVSFMKV